MNRRRPAPPALTGLEAILATDIEERPLGIRRARNKMNWQRDQGAPAWCKIQRAFLRGKILAGVEYSSIHLRRLTSTHVTIEDLQLDLAVHRAPLRIVFVRTGVYRIDPA